MSLKQTYSDLNLAQYLRICRVIIIARGVRRRCLHSVTLLFRKYRKYEGVVSSDWHSLLIILLSGILCSVIFLFKVLMFVYLRLDCRIIMLLITTLFPLHLVPSLLPVKDYNMQNSKLTCCCCCLWVWNLISHPREKRIMSFENNVLRRIFGSSRKEVAQQDTAENFTVRCLWSTEDENSTCRVAHVRIWIQIIKLLSCHLICQYSPHIKCFQIEVFPQHINYNYISHRTILAFLLCSELVLRTELTPWSPHVVSCVRICLVPAQPTIPWLTAAPCSAYFQLTFIFGGLLPFNNVWFQLRVK